MVVVVVAVEVVEVHTLTILDKTRIPFSPFPSSPLPPSSIPLHSPSHLYISISIHIRIYALHSALFLPS